MSTRRKRTDMGEFCKEKTPIARKEHKCDLCHRPIAKGERYVRIAQAEDGDFFDSKYHTGCYELVCDFIDKNIVGCEIYFNESDIIADIESVACSECNRRLDCNLYDVDIVTCPRAIRTYQS